MFGLLVGETYRGWWGLVGNSFIGGAGERSSLTLGSDSTGDRVVGQCAVLQ